MRCELHNLRGCLTCFRAEGECDYGACHQPATQQFRYPDQREVRPVCARHLETCQRLYGAAEVAA